jgi:hypothetical protein
MVPSVSRAAAVPAVVSRRAPSRGSARQQSSAGSLGVLPGRFRALPTRDRSVFRLASDFPRVTARRAGGQSHSPCVARSPSQKAGWPMATTTSRQETGAPQRSFRSHQKETTLKCQEETCLQRRL